MGCPVKFCPICVEVGTFPSSYWVIGHWHECTWPPLCSWWPLINYCEALRAYLVSCRMVMIMYGGWDPEMFLQSVPRCSVQFPYVFLWAVDVWAFKPVYHPTFLKFVIPALEGHENGFNGVTPFEVPLDPQVVAHPFEPFPQSLWMYGTTMAIFLLFDLLLLCSISLCNSCWLVQTTLALNVKVLKRLFLAVMKGLLSQYGVGQYV